MKRWRKLFCSEYCNKFHRRNSIVISTWAQFKGTLCTSKNLDNKMFRFSLNYIYRGCGCFQCQTTLAFQLSDSIVKFNSFSLLVKVNVSTAPPPTSNILTVGLWLRGLNADLGSQPSKEATIPPTFSPSPRLTLSPVSQAYSTPCSGRGSCPLRSVWSWSPHILPWDGKWQLCLDNLQRETQGPYKPFSVTECTLFTRRVDSWRMSDCSLQSQGILFSWGIMAMFITLNSDFKRPAIISLSFPV